MRKATILALVVIVVSLAILTTALALRLHYQTNASTMVTVRVTSDPRGATLSTLDQASVLGTTPLTMRYSVPDQWRSCVSYDGLAARWPSGLQLEVRAIELCPDGGMDQEIRLAAPGRQQARRTRVVPSQPNQSESPSEALRPMDLSVPDAVLQAAPATDPDALTPMDLSVPDSVHQAAPATHPYALTPMDLSVPDSARPTSAAPGSTEPTRVQRVKIGGYVEWQRHSYLVGDGQRILWDARTRFRLPPSISHPSRIPLGYEISVRGIRVAEGSVLAQDLQAKVNSQTAFENSVRAEANAAEQATVGVGYWVEPGIAGKPQFHRIVETGPDVDRCRAILRRLLPAYVSEASLRVRVVESPGINAYAAPNGAIWVFQGLLKSARSDDEVAYVLGHELAHYTHEHGRRDRAKGLWIQAAATASGVAIQNMKGGSRAAVEQAGWYAFNAWQNHYSRQSEDQADRVGLRYAAEAGYDPRGSVTFTQRMREQVGPENPVHNFFFGDHSTMGVRIAHLQDEVRRNYTAAPLSGR